MKGLLVCSLSFTYGVLVGYLWGVILAALSIHQLHVYVSNDCANPTFLLMLFITHTYTLLNLKLLHTLEAI